MISEQQIEFFCPYCRGWITDLTHRQHHHHDLTEPDFIRPQDVRVHGIVYESEDDYLAKRPGGD